VETESAGAHTGAATGGVLVPRALHDLRAERRPVPGTGVAAGVGVLTYPTTCVVLVTGLPGAGKSTLLARVVHPERGVVVLDADRVRARWEHRVGRLPYGVYRPLVRLSHYGEVARALRGPGAVVVHDSGRNPFMRRAILFAARRRGNPVHALLLDVTARQALSGQRERGRGVSMSVFARHHREWRDLLARLSPRPADPGGHVPEGFASCVLLDRSAASGLSTIAFADHVPRQARRRGTAAS